MKTCFILAFAIGFSLSTFAQNQWRWLNPQPSGSDCLKITFTDRLTGLILNYNGDLLRTVDQGAHWALYQNFPGVVDMAIADTTGIIATNNGTVYVSSDNGVTWQSKNTGLTAPIQHVSVASRDTLFLSTNLGQLFKSSDRGRTWALTGLQTPAINAMSFVNSRVGFVGGPGSFVTKTLDGGNTWQTIDSSPYIPTGVLALEFLNADTGYVSIEFDSVKVTHDGGKTWSSATCFQPGSTIDVVNDTLSYVGGEGGLLVRSGNGGQSYTNVTPTNGFKDGWDIYSLAFVAPDTGFAVGLLGRILKTTDGGQTWNTYSPTYIPVTAVTFPTPSTGFATTWNNVYKSIDSGQTWNVLGLTTGTAYGSSSRFETAHFLNADTGFVTASSSVQVYWTTNGGQTWAGSNPAPYSYDNTIGLSFLSPDTGYISLEQSEACCSGLIEKTTNGGQTWTTIWGSQYNGQYLSDVTFVDANTAYGIQYYQLFKSIDGGQTWNVIFTADYYQLTGIVFTDKNNGYLTDENGNIHFTHDGGQTWQTVSYPGSMIVPAPITSLLFFNGAVGYMGGGNNLGPGNYGSIFKTLDSGRTWHLVNTYSATSIQFTADSNVIIGGFGGEILKSSVGGWLVDSLQLVYDGSCGARLSASVGVALGRVDSVSFFITRPDSSVIQIPATPSSVVNGNTDCLSPDSSFLTPGVNYTARMRFFYNGVYRFSNPVSITGPGLAPPVVKDSLGWLVSSYWNNIWYLNGVVIPGTNAAVWQPSGPGVYSAQATNYPCVSALSDSVTFNSSWYADTLIAQSTDSCAELLSTTIHVELASIYNLSIEVTDSAGGLQEITVSPASATNSTVPISVVMPFVTPGMTYAARVRLVFNGGFQYGQPTSFVGVNIPQPTITRDAAGALHSSAATGNQWYLNNAAIPGAVQNQYGPVAAGIYTVQTTIGPCVSVMSDTVDIAAASSNGGTGGTSANLGVVIYPNPVKVQLTITNTQDRSLVLTIVDMAGVQVYKTTLSTNQVVIPVGGLAPGQYILHIQDTNSGESANIRFLKL